MSQHHVLQLRDYQQQAVDATIHYFRHAQGSAVIVLPTGAGKSIVIAELARIARGRVLILTHVKELVAQNADKAALLTDDISIYSAGLKQKLSSGKTVVAGIQSAARNPQAFDKPFSLVIIDECHRVSDEAQSQYQQLLQQLRQRNPQLHLLGLTATPYRLGSGWIYKRHYHGSAGNIDTALFDDCIFELPLRLLVKQGYLTPPRLLDGLSAQYDFSQLHPDTNGNYRETEVDSILHHCGRATSAIVKQLIQLAVNRRGVIIFAATVRHAHEIISLLPQADAALITAETAAAERDELIRRFKQQQLKFLVNVSVLTTGFDAPHVDLLAIMRPTASVALFQQMVGRGLRLSEGKQDCLIIDYAANGFDLFSPQIALPRPAPDTEPVQVICPECGFANIFWGKTNEDGEILEHFGRRCQGLIAAKPHPQQCQYRFRARLCPDCGAANDIAAKQCCECHSQLVDPDKRLREVLAQKHHYLFRVQQMQLLNRETQLVVEYSDIDGNHFSEQFRLATAAQRKALFARFIYPHDRRPGMPLPPMANAAAVIALADRFRPPSLLLLQKTGKHWALVEKYFDYQGRYQTEPHNG
ncbi:DEAD/DEAH box helicase [Shewanella dokdonensis]|uniref:DEAD/DEAH box helicase n=1 Tax=Shewanella dokdonensis TaxID=712036 RepID=A0ABX8DEN9_9GAMM|nr:DEAD/DEAH box helicase [Shewanella dokdonensis]MCL1076059.1 DEAD/DEAH box helicase [Shewanella dokdonensis]QVK23204.1 DEAD/DEAH box helicase [Shewanella dokdonensis]